MPAVSAEPHADDQELLKRITRAEQTGASTAVPSIRRSQHHSAALLQPPEFALAAALPAPALPVGAQPLALPPPAHGPDA